MIIASRVRYPHEYQYNHRFHPYSSSRREHSFRTRCRLVLIASGLALTSVGALAQGNVTLYGIATGNLTYINNAQTSAAGGVDGAPVGRSQFLLHDSGTSGITSSRWGLKGEEDLGEGRKALFQLESGLGIATGAVGQGNTLFGRTAYVGLGQRDWGTITFGRQLDAGVTFVSPVTFEWFGGNFATHPADYDNLNGTHRINRTVKYVSGNYGGLQVGGTYSFGDNTTLSQARVWSLGGTYSGGPLTVAAAVVHAHDPDASFYGTNANANPAANNFGSAGSGTGPASNLTIAGFASASTQQTASAAATYRVGDALFGAGYSVTQFSGLGGYGDAALNPLSYAGSTRLSTASVSLRYQATPAWRIGIGLDYTQGGKIGGAGGLHYTQINLATAYAFSKATEVYLTAAFQRAGGTDSLGQPAVAQIGYLPPSSTRSQSAISTGLIYRF